MSFLTLNGLAVPSSLGGEEEIIPIGDPAGRAFSGKSLRDVRSKLRRWNFSTTPESEADIEVLSGLIQGKGQNWSYDSDLYSGKGLGFGSTLADIHPSVGADGSVVRFAGVDRTGKYGSAVAVHPAVTNILDAGQRDCEDGVGPFASVAGATILSDTNHFYQGSKSIQVAAGAAGEGIITDAVSAAASTQYIVSAYVKAVAAMTVRIVAVDDVAGEIGTIAALNVQAGKWTRIHTDATTSVGATTLQIKLTKSDSGGGTFRIDALQAETGATPTTWADPSRSAGTLRYPPGFLKGAKSITVAAWMANLRNTPTAADGTIIHVRESASANSINVRRNGTNIDVDLIADDGTAGSKVGAHGMIVEAYTHVAAVYESQDGSDASRIKIYIDGALVTDAATVTNDIDFSTFADLWVGNSDGADHWPGLVDDLIILPYAATDAMITAINGFGKAYPVLPIIEAGGDFIPDEILNVEGDAQGSAYQGRQKLGEWKNNSRQLRFTLETVDSDAV